MKQDLQIIFDEALQRLKAGASLQEVLSAYPQQSKELEAMLHTALSLLSMPKKAIPEPVMQRKYMLAPSRKLWFAWLHVSKFASISVSAVLLFSALAGTGYAASRSIPGQALFSVKKTAESLRLKLATDPVKKANLQVAITKERLSDAEQVFNNPQHDPEQAVAALNELSSQTQKTIEAVNTIAKNSPTLQNSHPIVASLDDINQKQQALLKEIKPAADASDAAKAALKATEETASRVAVAKRFLEAASSDQALARLDEKPDAQNATGTVDKLTKDAITVSDTEFFLTASTTVKNYDGKQAKLTDITNKTEVSVTGSKSQDKITAAQIILLKPEASKNSGSVKGTATTTASSTVKSINSTSTQESSQNIGEGGQEENAVTAAPDPNTATGSFIPEDPQPQTAF